MCGHYPEHFTYISSFDTYYNAVGWAPSILQMRRLRHREVKWPNVTQLVWERIWTWAIWFHSLGIMCEVRYRWNPTTVNLGLFQKFWRVTFLAFTSALMSSIPQIYWNKTKKSCLVQNYLKMLRHQWNSQFVWNHFARDQYFIWFVRIWFFLKNILYS